jgi:hypothetical protein
MYKGRDAVVLARVGTRGAVKGGVVRVLYKGKTIGKARVPASGLARIRIDTSRFSASGRKVKTNEVTVRFDGTATAKRSSPVVMSLNVFGAL